jgi:hypothetical protein
VLNKAQDIAEAMSGDIKWTASKIDGLKVRILSECGDCHRLTNAYRFGQKLCQRRASFYRPLGKERGTLAEYRWPDDTGTSEVKTESEDAEIPFDNVFDRVTGWNPSVTDYLLEVPPRCLQCGAEINEKRFL